jgi:Tfp pilus assembly protein PilX
VRLRGIRLRDLRRERGFVLPLALGITVALAVSATSALYYTTQNQRAGAYTKGKGIALPLAEAGINNTMAVLSLPTNNALKQNLLPKCTGNAQANWNLMNLDGGYVRWCGDLDVVNAWWTVTSIGFVRSPDNASVITQKISSRIVVTPALTQTLNNPAWNYMFATRTGSTCDEQVSNNVSGATRMYVNGNLCLGNNVAMPASSLVVGGNLALSNGASIGVATSMSTRTETYVGKTCSYGTGVTIGANPCTGDQDARHVYSKMTPPSYVVGVSATVPVIAAPVADWTGWYTNAMPGPTQACSTSTTAPNAPPVFDTLTAGAPPAFIRDNNNPVQDLTPAYSYTCRVGLAASPIGELSWDSLAKTLTIHGTLFIDGSAQVANGALNRYVGQGTIYLSGTFYLSGKLCGGVSGVNCDFASWDPNSKMLAIIANGFGPTGNPSVPSGDSIYVANGGSFQGAFFATGNLDYSNNAYSDGPMIGSQIILSNNVTTQAFAPLIAPMGMPGSPEVYAQPNPPQQFSG